MGRKILLDRKPYIVIGVMPRDFEFPLVPGHLNNSELWVPMSFTQQELTTGAASWNFNMVGRLKAGITRAQAQSDAERVAQETMRTAIEPEQMANVLRATVRSIDAQLPLAQVQSIKHAVSDSEAPRRFNTAVISAFAIVAVLLAALGMYSVKSPSRLLCAHKGWPSAWL